MDAMMKDKFRDYVKGKAEPQDSEPDEPEPESEDGMYDIACRLCEALGVSEDKADKVADVLSELK